MSTTHPDPRQCHTWRDRFRPHIARILAETAGQTDREIGRALRQLWDELGMGQRAMHPYKVWLSEIKRQRHLPQHPKREAVDEGQLTLL